MMDSSRKIKAAVSKEIEKPSIGTTEQFLEIHKAQMDGGGPVIENAYVDGEEVVVNLRVVGERFCFAVWFDQATLDSKHSWSQELVKVECFAVDRIASASEMATLTSLPVTENWSVGDPRAEVNIPYKFSRISLQDDLGANTFDRKLDRLLSILEADCESVRRLDEAFEVGINVVYHHNANGMIGGPILGADVIKRLAKLGLSIGFDQYVGGELYR